MKKKMLLAGGGLLLCAPALVHAQAAPVGVGVADRPRPDYDPLPIRAGAFTFYPGLTVLTQATSNYYASNSNHQAEVYQDLIPEVRINQDSSIIQSNARLYFDRSLHDLIPREDANQFGGTAGVTYQPETQLVIHVDGSAVRAVESRSALGAVQFSLDPIRYDHLHGGANVTYTLEDLTLSVNGSIDTYDYKNSINADGSLLDQRYRNFSQAAAGGSARYSLRNGIGLIVSGNVTQETYEVRPGHGGFNPLLDINRDSSGFSLLGGITLEFTKLLSGNIQVGYLHQAYKDARLRDSSGPSVSADVLWNATPLTSVRLRASRTIVDSASFDVAGITETDFLLTVDHELFRYVIVSGDADYGTFSPNGIGDSGNQYAFTLRARYLLDRRFTLNGSVGVNGRTSNDVALRYNAVVGSVSLRVTL